MIKCPNKNLPEWKSLEKAQPELAYYLWDKYDGDVPDSIIYNLPIDRGINYIFNINDKLKNIGTEYQYSEYVNSIFPNSVVKSIVYHDTNKKFEIFKSKRGIYFNTNENVGFTESKYKVAAIINLENPKTVDIAEYGGKNTNITYPNNDGVIGIDNNNTILEYITASSDQTHILGTAVDIEMFKKFIHSKGMKKKQSNKIDEVIYYHKSKELFIKESDFKLGISKRMTNDVVTTKKWVSKDFHNKKRTIKHTEDSSDHDLAKRLRVTDYNYVHLSKLNEREAIGGEMPFIIETLNPTKDGVPNYSVTTNPAYLEFRWQEQKDANDRITAQAESGNIGGQTYTQQEIKFNHLQNDIDTGKEDIDNLNEKIQLLQQGLDAQVVMNSDLKDTEYGRIGKSKDGEAIIEINPNYARKDTVIHEFGHLYIDLLGGMSNNFIKRGRKLLKGSKIEATVIKNNPELSGELLDKEIVATSIGIEGSKIYDLQKKSPIIAWLRIFFNKLRVSLGINPNVALELSQRMLNNEINQEELIGELGSVWQYSKTMDDSAESKSKEEKSIDRVINKILHRITILKKKYEKSGNTEFKAHIETLLEDITKNKDVKGIVRYVDEVDIQTKAIDKRLDKMLKSKDEVDGKVLNDAKSFTGAFSLITEVEKLIVSTKAELDSKEDSELIKALDKKADILKDTEYRLKTIANKHEFLEKKYLATIIKPLSKRVEFYNKEKFQKEFYNVHGGYSAAKGAFNSMSDMEEAQEEFIASKMADNHEEIEKEKDEYIDRILTSAPRDISGIAAYIVDPKNLDDELIQTTIEILDKSEFEARHEFLEERNKANKVWTDLKEYKKTSNQTKLYDGIIEKIDGKETGFMVGKFYSTYLSNKMDLVNKFREAKESGSPIPQSTQVAAYTDLKNKSLNPQWNAIQALDKKNPSRVMYEYLADVYAKKDAIAPKGYKLELNIKVGGEPLRKGLKLTDNISQKVYRLPAIEKTSLERVVEQGLVTATIEGVKDRFINDTSTIEHGEIIEDKDLDPNLKEVLINEEGALNQTIPIHYRGSLENTSLQSYDLIGMSLMDQHSVSNYKSKRDVAFTLELIRDRSANRDVILRKNGKKLVAKLTGGDYVEADSKGINSAAYKALDSIIQDRLYGISSIDMGNIGKYSWNKISEGVMGWAGNTMLMGNWVAGGVNVTQGKYQNFIEAATSKHLDRKNLRKGELLYDKDMIGITNDIGALQPKSKTNLLIEHFNAFGDFSGILSRYSNDNKTKRELNASLGHSISTMTEHYIQGTMMYAILDKHTALDKDGKKIPIHEAYEVVDGKLQLIEGATFDANDVFQTERLVREIIKQVHGNYDNNNQALAQRYVPVKAMYMLRKWLIPGVQRRFRGFQNITKTKDNISVEDRSYNPILDQDMDGYYATTAMFVKELRKELVTLQFRVVSSEWGQLTDQERSNIKKSAIDVAAMITLYAAGTIMAGLAEDADDDDKEYYYATAYLFRRVYSEIRFYTSISEAMNIVQTPATTISMIERATKLATQLVTDPTERYVKGKRKGELKIKKQLYKVTPVFSQVERDLQESYEWLSK